MSEFMAYSKEKQVIESLLSECFAIISITEDLDGTKVRFSRSEPEPEQAELQLLNADARKYVVSILFAQTQHTFIQQS